MVADLYPADTFDLEKLGFAFQWQSLNLARLSDVKAKLL